MGGAMLPGMPPFLLLLLLQVELSYADISSTTTLAPGVAWVWRSCERERSLAGQRGAGVYVPQCDAQGRFTPQQCFSSSGFCWCVNVNTGEEVPGTRTPPGMLPAKCSSKSEPYAGDYCPPGWVRHDTRCFTIIQEPLSWLQAQSYCMFVGASLASVHSAEEDHFLQGLTMDAQPPFPLTWIGANDCIQTGVWMWSDGSMFDYDSFPRRPLPPSNETCVEMNFGVWRVWMKSSCDALKPFICAKDI